MEAILGGGGALLAPFPGAAGRGKRAAQAEDVGLIWRNKHVDTAAE